ncbi:MAG: hypothetical protein R3C28_09750 [Pirellulaceae bacterium]
MSDQTGDPHSPHDGPWWAHAFWLGWKFDKESYEKHISKWAPDLARDPVMRFLAQLFCCGTLLPVPRTMGAGYALDDLANGMVVFSLGRVCPFDGGLAHNLVCQFR